MFLAVTSFLRSNYTVTGCLICGGSGPFGLEDVFGDNFCFVYGLLRSRKQVFVRLKTRTYRGSVAGLFVLAQVAIEVSYPTTNCPARYPIVSPDSHIQLTPTTVLGNERSRPYETLKKFTGRYIVAIVPQRGHTRGG